MRLSEWFPNPQLESHPTPAEERANLWTHAVAAALAVVAGVWLLWRPMASVSPLLTGTGIVFVVAMVLTFAASAAYHWFRVGPRKARARRVDHAMIYVAIAGTHTPFAIGCIGGGLGWGVAATQWLFGLVGAWICLRHFHRFGWLQLGLKLTMGWMMIAVAGPAMDSIPGASLAWLLAGGVVYTAGVFFFLIEGLPFNHAIWHVFVVGGAASHFVALLEAFPAHG